MSLDLPPRSQPAINAVMGHLTTRRARSLLGRLAGLRSSAKQRALGFPNLAKAQALRWPDSKRATLASIIKRNRPRE
jgi:hypothetical protein